LSVDDREVNQQSSPVGAVGNIFHGDYGVPTIE
jgi:hypothetical protein